jgi:predicted house-cleaning noncanonical NTP pyrophosphatase (MazG superfamily)
MMTSPNAIFIPWLHMHQPPIWTEDGQMLGNLEKMLRSEPNSEQQWNAQWFTLAYKNPARYTEMLVKEGHNPRLVVDYSGVLLEEMALLSANGFFDTLKVGGETIGNVIEQFRYVLNEYPDNLEFTGTAYSHCYFPATPKRDRAMQIEKWQQVFADLFGETALSRVRGFWLPEMGMMGDPAEAIDLIRLLKRYGYEWIILPRSAVEHPEGWSTPRVENRVHWLVAEAGGETERIRCVIRDTDMGIRQQSGQNAEGCINGSRDRAQQLQTEGIKTPALVVPTSDGENGNVMMFEFFPNTFAPLYRNAHNWQDVGFMTVSEYLDTYGENPDSEIRLNSTGGSWIGGHQSWLEGDERLAIAKEIETLSQGYAKMQETASENELDAAQKALLLCETSCFVYWNSSFWFDQARKFIAWAKEIIPVTDTQTLEEATPAPETKVLTRHHKLIRDKIPTIIEAAGKECGVEVLSDADYLRALRKKLVEEAKEVNAAAKPEEVIQELADLLEVVEALTTALNIDPEVVQAKQQEKKENRGGFSERLMLLWTKE